MMWLSISKGATKDNSWYFFFKEHHFPYPRSLIVDIVMPGEEKPTILYVFHYLEQIQL